MSTDTQMLGDSRRRQMEMSARYAQEHGLDLIEEFHLEDIGVSAFRGANLSVESSLGRFLKTVRAGEVPPGSFLLMESLDRLSRQNVFSSLSIFTDLIKSGIKIVTLADNQVYTAGTTDFSQLVVSLAIMSRAHEESVTKSRRLSEAWVGKRRLVQEKKLTAISPAWLVLTADRRSFEAIEARASVVQNIFEDAASGLGTFAIARRLNASGIAPFGRSKGWQLSYVSKILTNRAVIGEYQPHTVIDGRRVPVGDAVKGYFPAVVDEALFHRVQAGRAQRRTRGAGRKGTMISNLFSGLARCSYCGSRMHFINKGSSPKGGTYLICDRSQRALGCVKNSWRYEDFEASFLTFVQELDLRPIIQGEAHATDLVRLDQSISALESELVRLEGERTRTFRLLMDKETSSDFVKREFARYQREIEAASAERAALVSERRLLESEIARVRESESEIQALIGQLQSIDGDNAYRLRSRIHSRLKALVDRIDVAALGVAAAESENMITFPSAADERYFRHFRVGTSEPRQFMVVFRDGVQRTVQPKEGRPAEGKSRVYRHLAPAIRTILPG